MKNRYTYEENFSSAKPIPYTNYQSMESFLAYEVKGYTKWEWEFGASYNNI